MIKIHTIGISFAETWKSTSVRELFQLTEDFYDGTFKAPEIIKAPQIIAEVFTNQTHDDGKQQTCYFGTKNVTLLTKFFIQFKNFEDKLQISTNFVIGFDSYHNN